MTIHFPALDSLELAHNKLPGIKDSQMSCSLRILDLQHNDIDDLSPILSCFTDLISLNLANNQISSFTKVQSGHPLTHLNIANNPVRDIAEFAALKILNSLQSLQLTIAEDLEKATLDRLAIVHYLPQLGILNRTKISDVERIDADRLFQPKVAPVINTLGRSLVTLNLQTSTQTVQKSILLSQTVHEVKSLFARLAKTRPTRIARLVATLGEVTIELVDDHAPLSQYDLQDGAFLSIVARP